MIPDPTDAYLLFLREQAAFLEQAGCLRAYAPERVRELLRKGYLGPHPPREALAEARRRSVRAFVSSARETQEVYPVKCPECGEGVLRQGPLTVRAQVRGEHVLVEFRGEECPQCGFQAMDAQDTADYAIAVADVYRAKHGLLTTAELRSRRERLGNMSQKKFADYLGVGIASVKRWELGAVQDEAMDRLIRLRTDPEEARQNLDDLHRLLGQPAA